MMVHYHSAIKKLKQEFPAMSDGQIHELSRLLGNIESKVDNLDRRMTSVIEVHLASLEESRSNQKGFLAAVSVIGAFFGAVASLLLNVAGFLK